MSLLCSTSYDQLSKTCSCFLQTYRHHDSFLQLWFEIAAHQKLQKQLPGASTTWGGLWTADTAEAFVTDAVHMYIAEEEWSVWQQRGYELLDGLYNQAARLQVVKVVLLH